LPFDNATLDSLYRNHGKYVSQVARSVRGLKAQGLLLQQDAVSVKQNAAQSEIGK